MNNEKNIAILKEIRRMARELPAGTRDGIINKCNKAENLLRKGKGYFAPREVVNEGPGGQEHFESQAKAVLAYMMAGNTITSLEALQLFGIISFPRRILDIEKMTGIAPQRRRIKVVNRSGKEVTVNQYWMEVE